MYIQMTVSPINDPTTTWTEEFDSENTGCLYDADPNLSPKEYSQLIIEYFNETLKPGECERELVFAKEINEES